MTWRCATCRLDNPPERDHCRFCGSPRDDMRELVELREVGA